MERSTDTMSEIEIAVSHGSSDRTDAISGSALVELELTVTDAEVCAELLAREDGRKQREFAVNALRIGVLAVRQAQGRVDADIVRSDGKRLISGLEHLLNEHQANVTHTVASSLHEYFDPSSGRFNERVECLIKKDGELEQLLRRQVGIADSELARTLANHLGENSPVLNAPDPEASDGFLTALTTAIEKNLNYQREHILFEFSLDNKESAISRLVMELSECRGKVGEVLEKLIDELVSEFSLDHEESALSRLVRRMEKAQKQISDEFSLDKEESVLARLRRELIDLFEVERKAGAEFHRCVLETLTDTTNPSKETRVSRRANLPSNLEETAPRLLSPNPRGTARRSHDTTDRG